MPGRIGGRGPMGLSELLAQVAGGKSVGIGGVPRGLDAFASGANVTAPKAVMIEGPATTDKKSTADAATLRTTLSAKLRSVSKQHGQYVLDLAYNRLPLDQIVAVLVESGMTSGVFMMGTSQTPQITLTLGQKDGFLTVEVENVARDTRRNFKNSKINTGNGGQFVFFEQDSKLKVRLVSEDALIKVVGAWVEPDSDLKEKIRQGLKIQAVRNEPIDASAVIRNILKQAVLAALPSYLENNPNPIYSRLQEAFDNGNTKEQNELKQVFGYHLDFYFKERKNGKLETANTILDDLGEKLVASVSAYIPKDWAKFYELAQAHIWQDYISRNTGKGFNALLYLLVRAYYELFSDRSRIYSLGVDRFTSMTNPEDPEVDKNKVQIAYEMAVYNIIHTKEAAKILASLKDLIEASQRMYKYALLNLNRFIPEASAFYEPIKQKLYKAIQAPHPDRSSFMQVVVHELAVLLVEQAAWKSPMVTAALGNTLPDSYKAHNTEKIVMYLETFLIKKGDDAVKEGLKNPEQLMNEFEKALAAKPQLLMLLTYPPDARVDQLNNPEMTLSELGLDQ